MHSFTYCVKYTANPSDPLNDHFIEEIGPEGESLGKKWVPNGYVHLHAETVTVRKVVRHDAETFEDSNQFLIRASLSLDDPNILPLYRQTDISYFGSDRQFQDVRLEVTQSEDGSSICFLEPIDQDLLFRVFFGS